MKGSNATAILRCEKKPGKKRVCIVQGQRSGDYDNTGCLGQAYWDVSPTTL